LKVFEVFGADMALTEDCSPTKLEMFNSFGE
jgi:hypothetical protein